MSEFIEVTEDVTIIETDDGNVEVIEVGMQGPPGPPGDPATNLVTSVAGGTGDVTLEDMGLDQVDNTSDLDKPVSTAQQAALDAKMNFPTLNNSVPVRGSSNNQSSIPYTTGPTAGTFALRDTGGQLRVGTAVISDAAVPKAQMDAADALRALLTGAGFTGTVTITASNPLELSTGGTTTRISGNNGDLTVVATSAGQFRLRRTATGLWIGNNVNAITPAQMLHVDGNARINGVDYIVGTGFPNGVQTAPVGSIYIDTAVTNGASSWIKTTGTGNTGWTVENGDTGIRDITSMFSTIFEVVNPNDFGVYIQRKNGEVFIWLKAQLKAGWVDGAIYALPFAMRGRSGNKPATLAEALQVAGSGRLQYQVYSAINLVNATVNSAGTRYAGSVVIAAAESEPWPTTLPGTAV